MGTVKRLLRRSLFFGVCYLSRSLSQHLPHPSSSSSTRNVEVRQAQPPEGSGKEHLCSAIEMGRLFESSSQTNGAKLASMDATAARGGGVVTVWEVRMHACVHKLVWKYGWVSNRWHFYNKPTTIFTLITPLKTVVFSSCYYM